MLAVAAGAAGARADECGDPSGERSWRDRVKRSVENPLAACQAAAVAALPMAPVGATLFTVAAYLAPAESLAHAPSWVGGHPLAAVAANFLGAWVLLAAIWHLLGYTTAVRANAGSFGQLQARLKHLKIRYQQLCLCNAPCAASSAKCIACGIVAEHICALEQQMCSPGPRWVLGSGYLDAWECLHRAEEALLVIEEKTQLIEEADYDRRRCDESTMAKEDQQALCAKLTKAITSLQGTPGGAGHTHAGNGPPPLLTQVRDAVDLVQELRAVLIPGCGGSPVANTKEPSEQELEAAGASVSFARKSLNQFRDERWAELVRARNKLAVATGLTGLALYALLWLVVLAHRAPGPSDTAAAVAAGTGYFLIGAMVGFLNQLRNEAEQSSAAAVDDYGLTFARLMVTPLLSGVAAVFGVVLIAIFSVTQTGQQPASMESLLQHLDVGLHPLNLIVAATFGLTPRLFLDRLREQTNQYRKDLQSSEAVQGRRARKEIAERAADTPVGT